MNAVLVQNLEKSYGDRLILRGCSFSVGRQEKVGVVGVNGAGKSTLLRLISGEEEADDGLLHLEGTVAILSQLPQLKGETVEDAVREASLWHQELLDEYQRAINSEDWETMGKIQDRLDLVGWDVSHNISAMLQRVQAPPKERKLSHLSGGEIRRVALAKTLLSNADVLILDEPTNHLDTETIEWLESFLIGYRGAVLLVTHDRYLLETVAERIVEVEDGLCVSYDGSYGDYLIESAERQAQMRRSEERRLKLIAQEAKWAARSPAARSTKQKARLQRLAELQDQRALPLEKELHLSFSTEDKFGATLLEVENLSLSFGGLQLFSEVHFSLQPKQRIGVLGPNGSGKSSLLKMISGQIEANSGRILRQSRLKIGILDQHRTGLEPKDSIFEAAGGGADFIDLNGKQMHVAGFLARFLFPREMLDQKVSLLSGGERARLLMAKLMLEGVNVLLLDEPTNDLDLQTLRALEDALIGFQGAVLLVTHDRSFLDRVCNSVLSFEENRVVSYADRHQVLLAKKSRENQASSLREKQNPREVKPKFNHSEPKLSYKEKQELAGLPDKIEALEGRLEEVNQLLGSPDSYLNSKLDISSLQKELEELEANILMNMERWEELSEKEEHQLS